MSALPLTRARRRVLTLLPDGTCLPERSACKVTGGERGRGGVIARLVKLGAPPPRPGDDPTIWLRVALTFVGAVEFDHPGNYRYAFRLGSRRQRRRVRVTGVADRPHPTVKPRSVPVPQRRPR